MCPADPRPTVRARVGDLAEQWDDLVDAQPLPTPFLRSWWVDHAASAEPVVLAWFSGDRLVGGAAFDRDLLRRGPITMERVRSLGQGHLAPDHLDVIATDEHRAAVGRAAVDWLRRPDSRLVDLDGLAAGGTLAGLLVDHVVERTAAPYTALTGTTEDYLAARPGRVRSTLKRAGNRFDRAGVVHRVVGPDDDVDAALDALSRLHEGRWADESGFLDAWPTFARAARAGIAAGDVELHQLVDADGEVVATELDLVVAGRVCFYQAGRRTEHEWRGCGSVLRSRIIADAIDRGRVEYDLLRGDEPYKAEWAHRSRGLVRCTFGSGLLGSAQVAAGRARQRLGPALARVSRAASRPGPTPRPGPPG